MIFIDKLNAAIERNKSLLCIRLDPDPEIWPEEIGSWDTVGNHLWQLEEWLKYLIAETSDLVCAYKVTLEFYRTLGDAGIGLLRSCLQAIPDNIPVILDAHFSGLNTSTFFAQTVFLDWKVDALTLNPYLGQDEVVPFLLYRDKAIFILCVSANPSAEVLQEYPNDQHPFYLNLVKEAGTWGPIEQLGLQAEGNTRSLSRIRNIAPERLILAGEIATETSELTEMLKAGLNSHGDGLIALVPQEILGEAIPRTPILALRDQINQIRTEMAQMNPTCSLWLPDICLLQEHPYKDLILQLYDINCIQFGEYVQASGATFPYYIDLRTIISHPQIFEKVLSAYAEILLKLKFDRIAGIPYGSLPTATGLGLRLNSPMIFPRKEVKSHGTKKLVEGKFNKGETVVLIDDILISGKSVREGAEKLKSVGLNIEDIVVFIDHQEGVREKLEKDGYRSHAVLTISEIAQTLYDSGRLNSQELGYLSKSNAVN